MTGGYRAENGIAQIQGDGDSQEGVESGWIAGFETPQGPESDPGVFCQHGLCYIAG